MNAPDEGMDDPNLRAAEYVLGTLRGEDRAAFALALAGDSGLRAAVRAWEARMAPLAEAERDVPPDPRTWPAIAGRLGPRDVGATGQVVRLERAVRLWRVVAVGAGALAAGLALVVAGGALRPAPAGPQYVAVVNRGGELPALMVRVDTAAGLVQVRSLAAQAPADRSLELWYVTPGAAPRSLGVLDEASTRMPIPAALRGTGAEGASFAVSVEPRGGSPTGTATGPVIYSGQLVRD